MRSSYSAQVRTVGLIQWDWDKIGHHEDVDTRRQTDEAFQSHARLTLIGGPNAKDSPHTTASGVPPRKALIP